MRDFDRYSKRRDVCSTTFSLLEKKTSSSSPNEPTEPKFKVTANCCKTKLCPKCQKIFVNNLRSNFKKSFLEEKLRMFTISIKPSGDITADMHSIERSFSLLLKRLRHRFSYLRYFKVIEVGKQNGMIHIHGIWNIYVEWSELQTLWIELSGSRNVYLEKVKSFEGSIDYILKYMKKSFSDHTTVKYFYEAFKRQYSYSNKDVLDKRKKSIWSLYDNYTRTKTEMISFVKTVIAIFSFRPDDFKCTEIENFYEEISADIVNDLLPKPPDEFSVSLFADNLPQSQISDAWLS